MIVLVYVVVSIILNLFSFFIVCECIVFKKSKKYGFKVILFVLFKNKLLLVLVLFFLVFVIGFNIKFSIMVYYFIYNVY